MFPSRRSLPIDDCQALRVHGRNAMKLDHDRRAHGSSHGAVATAARGLSIACAVLQGCVFVPRTTLVYDEDCQIEARQMILEMQQIGAFVGCRGEGCAAILAGAGVVAAASAVISGSIVVAGNIVYWFERQGACRRLDDSEAPMLPPLPPPPPPQPPD
ncbi:MAG: hypothetical protein KDH15_04965 [Rhodocyclaceae bacterium]|nr:hypothetical protein [Rhodocyclaceae bacterium]